MFLNVNLRSGVLASSLHLTGLAEVLVLVAAGLVVLVKVGLQSEGLVALPALVVLEGGVGLHVGPQVGPVCKTFPAVCASEGLVSSVGSEQDLLRDYFFPIFSMICIFSIQTLNF